MKIRSVLAAIAATTLLAITGCAAAAATIDILQVTKHAVGGSPAAPAGFTLLDLGTGNPNALQTTSDFTVGGVTFSFGGLSGEYAGNAGLSSPFGADNTTKNFVVAAGGGGTVDVTWASTQNELYVLWGTVDTEPGRNLITIGATAITGAAIEAAIISQGFTFDGTGLTNTYLKITGLPDFTSATFSDSQIGSFEFAIGVSPTPLPATLPLFLTGLGALGLMEWRRRRTGATALH